MDRTREIIDRFVAWSPVLLLGALAALTYWLDAQVTTPTARRDGSTRHDPDLFLQDFKAITFDAKGNPHETLSAARAEHFPDDESAELTKPRLSLADPGRPTLTVTADHGRIDGDRNSGDFSGNVRVERAADPKPTSDGRPSGPVTVTTRALHVTTKFHRKDFGHMDIGITIDDAKAYTKPWGTTVEVTLLPNTQLMEFICLENEKKTGGK